MPITPQTVAPSSNKIPEPTCHAGWRIVARAGLLLSSAFVIVPYTLAHHHAPEESFAGDFRRLN